jgi:hypothetical protein
MGKQDTIIEKLKFIEWSTMKCDKNLGLKFWLIHADCVGHRLPMRPVFINHLFGKYGQSRLKTVPNTYEYMYNWFLMMPSIATKFQYVNSPFIFTHYMFRPLRAIFRWDI